MKKLMVILTFSFLFFSCAKEDAPDIITDYTGTWESQEFNYYPHRQIEIRKDGNGSLTIEHDPITADVLSGKVTIIDNSVLQISNEKMRINDVPALDSIDLRYWMQVEGVWYKRN
jgi:hypothetical protein